MRNKNFVSKPVFLAIMLLAGMLVFSCGQKSEQTPQPAQQAPQPVQQVPQGSQPVAQQAAPPSYPQASPQAVPYGKAPVAAQQPAAQAAPPAEDLIPEGDPTPPPRLAIKNPEMVVVPSQNAQVYMVPNVAGVYFYGGNWYRRHHGV